MDILVRYYEKSLQLHKSDPLFSIRINRSWEVFDKYYKKTGDIIVYIAVVIFYPSYLIQYIKQNWETKQKKSALISIKKLWEKEYKGLRVEELSVVTGYKLENLFEK